MYKNLGYDGEPNVMEEDKQVLYKCLAEYKLRLPMTQPANIDADMWEQLKELNEAIESAFRASLDGPNQLETYIEKYKHFTHMYFAEEKLDLESKFAEGAQVSFVCWRDFKKKRGRDGKKHYYSVYKFSLPPQGLDELVLYTKVVVAGIRGSVTKIDREERSIEVTFEDMKDGQRFDPKTSYTIDVDFNERMYRNQLFSFFLLRQGYGKHAIFPDTSELMPLSEFKARLEEHERALAKTGDHTFDREQRSAIFSIVNGFHGSVPFLLWGPPGTGKTVTIVECIRQIVLNDPDSKILICTPSNSAADLVAVRILDKNFIPAKHMRRYYSISRNTNERDRRLDKIITMEDCSMFGQEDRRFVVDEYKHIKAQNIRLFFTTLACSAYLEKINEEEDNFFTHVFIDEAGQALEQETLIPITRFGQQNTRIILSGDHEQLGAVIKANYMKQYKPMLCSLMERLVTTMRHSVYSDGRTFCQLKNSHRCHPKIIQFSSEHFYENQLQAVRETERRGFCEWEHLPKKGFPVILHVLTQGAEIRQKDGGRSFHNEVELEVVLKYIQLIKETGQVSDSEIGVISPYKHQAHKIRTRLGQQGRNITVDSVECYQGSERRVVIMSLSRSEQIGFLSEYKRMNTAFTRAKDLLIVILSESFIERLEPRNPQNYWTRFIQYCIEHGGVTIDKFAGEDGQPLTAAETKSFKQRLERKIAKKPDMAVVERIERKKKPDLLPFEPMIQSDDGFGKGTFGDQVLAKAPKPTFGASRSIKPNLSALPIPDPTLSSSDSSGSVPPEDEILPSTLPCSSKDSAPKPKESMKKRAKPLNLPKASKVSAKLVQEGEEEDYELGELLLSPIYNPLQAKTKSVEMKKAPSDRKVAVVELVRRQPRKSLLQPVVPVSDASKNLRSSTMQQNEGVHGIRIAHAKYLY